MNNKQENTENAQTEVRAEVQPNESGGFYFSSFLKITDPNSYHINMFNNHINYVKYNDYLNYFKQFGTCFVRELDK